MTANHDSDNLAIARLIEPEPKWDEYKMDSGLLYLSNGTCWREFADQTRSPRDFFTEPDLLGAMLEWHLKRRGNLCTGIGLYFDGSFHVTTIRLVGEKHSTLQSAVATALAKIARGK